MITQGPARDNRPAPLPDPVRPVTPDAEPAAARPFPACHRRGGGFVPGALGRPAAPRRGGGAARFALPGLRRADRLARSRAGAVVAVAWRAVPGLRRGDPALAVACRTRRRGARRACDPCRARTRHDGARGALAVAAYGAGAVRPRGDAPAR